MLRGEGLDHGLASTCPQLPDPMHPLPPHMVWTGLDTAIAVHYIKLLLTSELPIIEVALTSMEHPSL